MNKEVDDEFVGIKDVYALRCICTELKKDKEKIKNIIDNAKKYIEDNKEYTTIKKSTKKWQYGKVVFEEVDEEILNEDMIKELLELLDKEAN